MTDEDFLTPARARLYAALVSEPKQLRLYQSNHALNAEARRDRIEFLRQQLHFGPVDWIAAANVPQLVLAGRPLMPITVNVRSHQRAIASVT